MDEVPTEGDTGLGWDGIKMSTSVQMYYSASKSLKESCVLVLVLLVLVLVLVLVLALVLVLLLVLVLVLVLILSEAVLVLDGGWGAGEITCERPATLPKSLSVTAGSVR